jgi:hypothetical protein
METMTQEDKELLIKDLCARLPYGVKMNHIADDELSPKTLIGVAKDMITLEGLGGYECVDVEDYKPYLFPTSSMTEEQKKEFLYVAGYEVREEDCGRHTETYYYDMVGHEHNFYPNSDAIDWCIKNNFDYRGLIPKGLAIDATGLNIY